MSSLSIRKIKTPEWLEGNRRLRTAAVVFAGLVLADLFMYFILVAPSAALLTSSETKYAELRRRHAEAVLFKKQKPLFAGISAGITTQKDMPLLVKEVGQAARRLNLAVAAVTYDMPSHGGGELAQLSFSFPAEGRYPELKRFIYDMETADRFVGIQELKLESDQGKVKLQMKLMTYVKGQ